MKGFKIGLELMVRCRPNQVIEVPITFQDRVEGESKLTMTQNIYYIQQLLSLYMAKYGFAFFLLVVLALALSSYYFANIFGLNFFRTFTGN